MSSDQLTTLANAAASAPPLSNLDSHGIAFPPALSRETSNSMYSATIPNPPQIFTPNVKAAAKYNNSALSSLRFFLLTRTSFRRPIDWHLQLSIEERKHIRSKIKAAYAARLKSYEELLEVIHFESLIFMNDN